MRMLRSVLFFLAAVLLWSGCQKAQDGLPGSETPVFFLNLTGLPVSAISAGLDGYYMFTDYKYGVEELTTSGSFGLLTCSSMLCSGSLRFEMVFPSASLDVYPDSMFKTGEVPYHSGDSSRYILRLTAIQNEPVDSFTWKVDHGLHLKGASVSVEYQQAGAHEVELSTWKNGALRSKVNRLVDLTGHYNFPSVDVKTGFDNSGFVKGFWVETISLGGPLTYVWSNDSTNNIFFAEGYDLAQTGIGVTVTDPIGYSASANLYEIDSATILRQTTNFTFSVDSSYAGILNNSGVAVLWKDLDGVVWRSNSGPQNGDAYFKILDSRPYDLNEKSQKTRIMLVDFSCRLYNPQGTSMNVSGKGYIGMAYP